MSSRAKKRVHKKQILKITNGVVGTAANLVLWNLYFGLSLFGKSGARGVYRAGREADELIAELDYETFRNTLYNLRQKGFIKSLKQTLAEPKITKSGLKKITESIRLYDEKRTWDKLIYLINYDIPSKHNRYRDMLRETLKKIGAIDIQKSLYLTPYNPKGVLKKFTEEHGYFGEILISTLSRDSSIGEHSDLRELLWNCYNLDNVNIGYEKFIDKYKNRSTNKVSKTKVAFEFLSIVQDDPQLPFELLPNHYKGDEAYLLYRRLVKK